MDGIPHPIPRTVEEVFSDFKGRRIGLIKALTIDVEKFYQQCDPEKENLCLYGLPNETWEVNLPVEEVPPELPEPALGINFARDGMQEMDWLSLVAVHSDSWLLAVAFYFGARFGFGKNESGEEEEEDDEQGATCGACGESYGTDEFWICCDICERWFHGKCVKITPAKAEHIKQYKCPGCSGKRARV
ncbi:PHD finger protein ALFIN-LIKE 1 [Linum perenne]